MPGVHVCVGGKEGAGLSYSSAVKDQAVSAGLGFGTTAAAWDCTEWAVAVGSTPRLKI